MINLLTTINCSHPDASSADCLMLAEAGQGKGCFLAFFLASFLHSSLSACAVSMMLSWSSMMQQLSMMLSCLNLAWCRQPLHSCSH